MFLSQDDKLIGAFLVEDRERSDAKVSLTQLRNNKLGNKRLSILSGDNKHSVNKRALSLGIDSWFAEQSPDDKLQQVRHFQKNGDVVVMVGDGINDAPVLAQADVSIVLGASSDLAKTSADVILLNDSLANIPYIFTLALRCNNNIKQNVLWALAYNLAVLPLAVSGLLTPWMAVIGMSLSSLIVVTNSLRLLK